MDGDEKCSCFCFSMKGFNFHEFSSLKTITEALKLSRDNHLDGKEDKRNFELMKMILHS